MWNADPLRPQYDSLCAGREARCAQCTCLPQRPVPMRDEVRRTRSSALVLSLWARSAQRLHPTSPSVTVVNGQEMGLGYATWRGGGGGRKRTNGTSRHIQHSPNTPTTGLRKRGNDTSKSTGRSGRQNAATRRNMRRDERVTVQGPVKKPQRDGMSHGGGGGQSGGPLLPQLCDVCCFPVLGMGI